MIKVKSHRISGGTVKAHKRKVKGKGIVMVKSTTRKSGTIKGHSQNLPGKALYKRNSVGTIVYRGNIKK